MSTLRPWRDLLVQVMATVMIPLTVAGTGLYYTRWQQNVSDLKTMIDLVSDENAEKRHCQRRGDEHDRQLEPGRPEPHGLKSGIGCKRGERADRQHITMRKLDDVEHAEEQREAHRDKRVHHAEHQPVHDVLREQPDVHARCS